MSLDELAVLKMHDTGKELQIQSYLKLLEFYILCQILTAE